MNYNALYKLTKNDGIAKKASAAGSLLRLAGGTTLGMLGGAAYGGYRGYKQNKIIDNVIRNNSKINGVQAAYLDRTQPGWRKNHEANVSAVSKAITGENMHRNIGRYASYGAGAGFATATGIELLAALISKASGDKA